MFVFTSRAVLSFSFLVCKMGGKWLDSCCFIGYYFQNVFETAPSILLLFSSGFSYKRFVDVEEVQPYNCTNTAKA